MTQIFTSDAYDNPNRERTAHIITSDQEAIEITQQLAAEFAQEAAERDRDQRLPYTELEKLANSGLQGITVPKEYGGAGVSNVTLAEVIKLLSEADSSIGQIPQNHLYMVEAIRLNGTQEQKRHFFRLVLEGKRFGNAFTEVGTKTAVAFKTRLTRTDIVTGATLVLTPYTIPCAGSISTWVTITSMALILLVMVHFNSWGIEYGQFTNQKNYYKLIDLAYLEAISNLF